MRLYEANAQEIYDKFLSAKMSPDEYFSLLKLDPTAKVGDTLTLSGKGKFTDWVVAKYLKSDPDAKGRFVTEDGTQIKAGLEVFEKLSRNNEGTAQLATMVPGKSNAKDLNQYTPEEIRGLTVQKKVSNNEFLGKKDEDKIDVLLDTPQFKVVSPRTHAADRKWGTGTSWCTATSNPHWYKKYTADGPLFIILEKKSDGKYARKWQYHEQSGQFMDVEDKPVSRRQWFDMFASRNQTWEDAVDQVAEALEKRGCAKFSLSALFNDNPYVSKILLGKEPEEVALGRMNDWDKRYILTDAFLNLSMDDFLEVYEYAESPSDSPALSDMLTLQLHQLPSPADQVALRLLRFVDSERPDLVPRNLVKSMNEGSLLMASFETFRLGMMTLARIPQERRFLAFKNAVIADFSFKQPVQKFLSKKDGDDTLLEILMMVLKDDATQLDEARPRPDRQSVKTTLDSTREKQTRDSFIMLMTTVLEPIAGAFKKSWKFIQSNGTVVDFEGEDEADYEVKTPIAIVSDLLNTGDRIPETERQTLSFALGSAGKPENADDIQAIYLDAGGSGVFNPFPKAIRSFYEKVKTKLNQKSVTESMEKVLDNPELLATVYSLWSSMRDKEMPVKAFKESQANKTLVSEAMALLTEDNIKKLIARVSKKPVSAKPEFVGPFQVFDSGRGYLVNVAPDLAVWAKRGMRLALNSDSPMLGFTDVYDSESEQKILVYCREAEVTLTQAGIKIGDQRDTRVFFGNGNYVPVGFNVLGKKKKEDK